MNSNEFTSALINALTSEEVIKAIKLRVKTISGFNVHSVVFNGTTMEIYVDAFTRYATFLETDLVTGKDAYGSKDKAGITLVDLEIIKNIVLN